MATNVIRIEERRKEKEKKIIKELIRKENERLLARGWIICDPTFNKDEKQEGSDEPA